MSEGEEVQTEADLQTATEKKLAKLGKYLLLSSIGVLWAVSAGLSIRDLWKGVGILETPWIIFGIVLTLVIIFLIILPLLRSLKEDVKDYNKRKEEKNLTQKDDQEKK